VMVSLARANADGFATVTLARFDTGVAAVLAPVGGGGAGGAANATATHVPRQVEIEVEKMRRSLVMARAFEAGNITNDRARARRSPCV